MRRILLISAVAAAAGLVAGLATPAEAGFWDSLKRGLGIAVDKTEEATDAVVSGTKHVAKETAEGATEAYEETKEGLGEAAHDIKEDSTNLYKKVTE